MFRIVVKTGEKRELIEAQSGESILDEALKAGVNIPYSCKKGVCGQCASTLLDGDIAPVNSSYPTRQSTGEVLLCNTVAKSDISLLLPYFPELDRIKVARSPAKIHALNRLNDTTVEVVLRVPPSQSFEFLPGQFIHLTNKFRITRSYSLADAPNPDKLLRLHVRRVAEGAFSDYLFEEACEGDLLYLDGPHGHFFVRDNDMARETIFLATGTGIAPVVAILRGLTSKQRDCLGSVSVYWGNRNQSDEYIGDQLRALSQQLSFEYWPVFSQGGRDTMHYIQDMMASHHPDLTNALVFACGNPAMIEAARMKCASLGLPAHQYRSDPFTSS